MITNPHDKFFKQMFRKKEVAAEFLENYLPENLLNIIDTKSLEISKDSFVDSDYTEYFSDIVYNIKIKEENAYIYCLFEHKSYPQKDTAFQLLKYLVKLWELHRKQSTEKLLPVILPILIYHGDKRYNIDKNFIAIVNSRVNTEKYIPDFEFLFYDFSIYTDQQIIGSIQLQITLKIMHSIYTKNHFEQNLDEILRLIKKLSDSNTILEYFTIGLKYILEIKDYDLDIYDLQVIQKKVNKIIPERSDALVTIADKLREEGKANELIETITVLLRQKLDFNEFPDNLKEQLNKADLDTLILIRNNLLQINSLKELESYLN